MSGQEDGGERVIRSQNEENCYVSIWERIIYLQVGSLFMPSKNYLFSYSWSCLVALLSFIFVPFFSDIIIIKFHYILQTEHKRIIKYFLQISVCLFVYFAASGLVSIPDVYVRLTLSFSLLPLWTQCVFMDTRV